MPLWRAIVVLSVVTLTSAKYADPRNGAQDEGGKCDPVRLPTTTFFQLYGHNAKTCCPENRFLDQTGNSTHSAVACGTSDGDLSHQPMASVTCPLHCKSHNITEEEFEVINGQMRLRNSSGKDVTVPDYCLFYECKDESWQIGAEICLCFEEEKIAEMDSKITAKLNRCCSGVTNLIQVSNEDETGLHRINCLFDPQSGSGSSGKFCPTTLMEVEFDENVEMNNEIETISFSLYRGFEGLSYNISIYSDDYCVGFAFNKENFSIGKPLKSYIVYCQPPCNGRTPCIRTCCLPKEKLDSNGNCQPSYRDMTKLILDQLNRSLPIHLEMVENSERRCAEGFERKLHDKLYFVSHSGNVQLETLSNGKTFHVSEYCIVPDQHNNIVAEVCEKVVQDPQEVAGSWLSNPWGGLFIGGVLFLVVVLVIRFFLRRNTFNFTQVDTNEYGMELQSFRTTGV